MRGFLALIAILAVAAAALAQTYTPKPGETVMRVAIEGRGNLFIRLFTDEAPKTTTHIVKLAKQGFYDGQRFFRVVRQPRPFLVQIGDPQSRSKDLDDPAMGTGGSGAKIAFEDSGKLNDKAGVVGLSHREGDRDAGDSQFYILLAPSKFLDGNYTVFGQVVAGMDVLQKVEKGDRVTAVTILGG
ncbi:MAG: peptidylprolyl isomerase [Fimbriimonadaceae bacterium]|nr:peptidylprolyl isomerase [Chthonomonadaceae bacterium]MCO5296009.1 peptidylprolyl isomerase [Fimbriimonadaceae bacterium]